MANEQQRNQKVQDMPESPAPDRQPETAKRFFDRGVQVAQTNNHDYALELYRDGLKWDPDALEIGHKPLREISLKRKAAGGKGPGLREQAGLRRAGDPKEKLGWSAFMLAKEPDNPRYMELLLDAAMKVGAEKTARWIAGLLYDANRSSGKTSLDRFITIVDAMEKVEDYDLAVKACTDACRMKPQDMNLNTRLKNLSAMQTMQRGKYETAEDFKDSLDDAKRQMNQQDDLRVVSSDQIIDRQVEEARREYDAEPTAPGKIYAYVDALSKRGREDEEAKAIEVLQQAFEQSRSFRFRERIGDIRIKQFHRKAVDAAGALQTDPTNPDLKAKAQQIARDSRNFEEQEYAARVANYPTDLTLKFEYGRRLFSNRKFDDAIPVLQQAENDPKNRLRAKSLLGQSFFNLGFSSEAVDTYRRAIEELEVLGGDTAKELYYNMGLALEQMGKTAEADAAYSQVMQWDFNYRDVRKRLQKLRNPPKAGSDPE